MSGLQKSKEFIVQVDDDASFVEALSKVDKYIFENPNESIFSIFEGYIHNYLQLFWNPEKNKVYDDIGLMPYGPDDDGNLRRFMPIRDNINFILFPDSVIDLQPDSGCWWEKVRNRLDIGKFKHIIRKKYGKDNEIFAHYFKSNEK